MAPKASKAAPDSKYEFQDIVIAKVKGHPAWPARVLDPATDESLPDGVRDAKKMTQKNAYLVRFFKTCDFAWMNAKELSKLEHKEIEAVLAGGKKKQSNDLRAAYEIALDPVEWEAEQVKLFKDQKDMHNAQLKAAEEDELEEGGEAAATAGKKRKRKSEAKPKEPKKKKTEVEGKKKGKKEKADDSEGPMGKVREWRHKLQKLFLGGSDVTEAQMPGIDQTFKDIEAFEMQTEWLVETKLGKVLKRIGLLPDDKFPNDDKFKIKTRSQALQQKWAAAFPSPADEKAAAPANEDLPADAAAIPDKPEATPAEDKEEEEEQKEDEEEVNGKTNGDVEMDEDAAEPEAAAEAEEEDKAESEDDHMANGDGPAATNGDASDA